MLVSPGVANVALLCVSVLDKNCQTQSRLFTCLFTCLFICLLVCLPVHLFVYLFVRFCLLVCLPVHLFTFLFTCLFICLFTCLFTCIPVRGTNNTEFYDCRIGSDNATNGTINLAVFGRSSGSALAASITGIVILFFTVGYMW